MMATIYNEGVYVPTTTVLDVYSLYSLNSNSKEFKDFIVQLIQNYNNLALAINIKTSGYYIQPEFLTSNLFFNEVEPNTFRSEFRVSIPFGALPNAGTKSVAHGIDIRTIAPLTTVIFVGHDAWSSKPDQTSFIPIPFSSSVLNENIKLTVTSTNIVITTAIDYSAYTNTIVTLRYLKS
jgi:hypothetical protein